MSTPITLLPGTLPEGYCYPDNPQQFNVDIISRVAAFLDQNFPGIYVGDTEPPADMRDRIWFNTLPASLKFYWYLSGAWMRLYEVPASSNAEWIWKGSEADLVTFAGGSAGIAAPPVSGPLWEVDHLIDGRMLIGPGTIPGTAFAVAVGATADSSGASGAYEITLTEAQGASGIHIHGVGLTNSGNDDAFFRKLGLPNTVPAYLGYYITGSNGNVEQSKTTADLYTLPSGADGAGVTPTAHPNMPPYIGRFVIKRTSRTHVLAPY